MSNEDMSLLSLQSTLMDMREKIDLLLQWVVSGLGQSKEGGVGCVNVAGPIDVELGQP